ncbi:hypothetical protein QFC22_000624 [Naganishia vaughanmartiniae]|uniref:Uncharacterized protein n=1 Tax=Naganishia vaughanmartiniae TaxID=1424756 RepID=A0ACC2XNW3_9TREE|nr:hypothetical protein QFC22_000624 [Naganishia vaughanmartiniae]
MSQTTSIHEFTFPTTDETDQASFLIPTVNGIFSNNNEEGAGEWSGWTYDRPRTTWIEARHLPSGIVDVDPYIASHLLLLTHRLHERDTNTSAASKGIIAIYPVCSTTVHATISAGRKEENEPSGLFVRLRKIVSLPAGGETGKACVVIVRGDSERGVHRVVERAVREARLWLRRVEGAQKEDLKPFVGLEETSPLQGLGFCTWSSIGEGPFFSLPIITPNFIILIFPVSPFTPGVKPTMENLTNLLTSLSSAQIPIQSFMLDDGWLSTRHYIDSSDGTEHDGNGGWNAALWAFEATEELGGTVQDVVKLVKEMLPTVRDVGVWMTLEGYWKSIHPDSPLVQKYRIEAYDLDRRYMPGISNEPGSVTHLPTGRGTWILPHPDDAFRFWKDWFTYLKQEGVTWVKVDNQASLSFLSGVRGAEAHTAMWRGMTQAAEVVWGAGRVIYCMSHSERMFNGDAALGVASDDRKLVVRNSDDFGLNWRHNADQLHIFHNIYSAILTSHLAHVPDADMFMTRAQYPLYHALLRALFPGPLLLSDKQGQHDERIIGSLLGTNKRGDVHVVKSMVTPARPLANRVFPNSSRDTDMPVANGDGKAVLAAVAYPSLHAATIAAWNTRDRDHPGVTRDTITRLDILDALEIPIGKDEVVKESEKSYILYRHGYANGLPTQEELRQVALIEPSHEGTDDAIISFTLEHTTCEAFTVSQLYRLSGSDGRSVRIAVLGLVDKLAGLSGLRSVDSTKDALTCGVMFDGILGFVACSSREPADADIRVSVDGQEVASESKLVKVVDESGKQELKAFLLSVPIKQGTAGGQNWNVQVRIA